jgi:hypothetical protein
VFVLLEHLAVQAGAALQRSPSTVTPIAHVGASAALKARSCSAAMIAAIRLNKEEIRNTPAVQGKIADSVKLAEMIVAKINS